MNLTGILRVLLATLLAALAGCSAMAPKLETPRLTIVSASMTSGDIFSQNFLVRISAQNPNDRELPVKGIEYKLFLQGDSFAEGTSPRGFTLPANGETEFDMTVRTNFVSSIGRLLTRLNGKNQVEYVFEGKVMLASGMVRSIPFQESGSVDLATKL